MTSSPITSNSTMLAIETQLQAAEAVIRQAQEAAAAAQLAADPMANYRSISDLNAVQIHHVALNLQQMHKNVLKTVPAECLATIPVLEAAKLNLENEYSKAMTGSGDYANMPATQVDMTAAGYLQKLNLISMNLKSLEQLWNKAFFAAKSQIQEKLWQSVGVIPGGRAPVDRAKSAVNAVEEHLMSLPDTKTITKPKKVTPEFPQGGVWVNLDYKSVTEAHWITVLATLKEARLQMEFTAKDADATVEYVGGTDDKDTAFKVKVGEMMAGGISEAAAIVALTSIAPNLVDRSDEQLSEPTEFEGFDNVKAAGEMARHLGEMQKRRAGAQALARSAKLERSPEKFTSELLTKENKQALIAIAKNLHECGYMVPTQAFKPRTAKADLVADIQAAYTGGAL